MAKTNKLIYAKEIKIVIISFLSDILCLHSFKVYYIGNLNSSDMPMSLFCNAIWFPLQGSSGNYFLAVSLRDSVAQHKSCAR